MLEIYNLKPKIKSEFLLEADPKRVKEKQAEYRNEKRPEG